MESCGLWWHDIHTVPTATNEWAHIGSLLTLLACQLRSSKMWKAQGSAAELYSLKYHTNTSCTITDNHTPCWMFATSPSTFHAVHQWPPTRISRLLCRHQSIPRHSCHIPEARCTFSYPYMLQVPHWHATPCQDWAWKHGQVWGHHFCGHPISRVWYIMYSWKRNGILCICFDLKDLVLPSSMKAISH